MSEQSAFSTGRTQPLLKLAGESRILDHYDPEYRDFLDLFSASDYESYKDFLDAFGGADTTFLEGFSGGKYFEAFVPGSTVTFTHDFGRIPVGRILLYSDTIASVRDINWTVTKATVICSQTNWNVKIYYF